MYNDNITTPRDSLFSCIHLLFCFVFSLVLPSIPGSGEVATPEVIVGEEITLECLAMGIPQPDVRWHRTGSDLSKNHHSVYS